MTKTKYIDDGRLVSWLQRKGFDYIAVEREAFTLKPFAIYEVSDELEKAIKEYEIINAGLALMD